MSQTSQDSPGPFEFLDILAAYESARRRLLFGMFGTPVIAAVWASTCSQAKQIDAGQLSSTQILDEARGLLLIWDPIWLTGYQMLGTRGLHAVFGAIVAASMIMGVLARARVRAFERRYGQDRFRDADLAELRQTTPELAEKIEAAKSRPRAVVRPSGAFRIVTLVFRLVPIAALVLTLVLVWLALKP